MITVQLEVIQDACSPKRIFSTNLSFGPPARSGNAILVLIIVVDHDILGSRWINPDLVTAEHFYGGLCPDGIPYADSAPIRRQNSIAGRRIMSIHPEIGFGVFHHLSQLPGIRFQEDPTVRNQSKIGLYSDYGIRPPFRSAVVIVVVRQDLVRFEGSCYFHARLQAAVGAGAPVYRKEQ